MAALKTQPVVSDLGSQEVAQLIYSYNQLLDTMGALITELKSAAVVGDIVTAATTAEIAMEAVVYKLEQNPAIPLAPAFAKK